MPAQIIWTKAVSGGLGMKVTASARCLRIVWRSQTAPVKTVSLANSNVGVAQGEVMTEEMVSSQLKLIYYTLSRKR